MNFTIQKCVVNVIAVTNPTQYTKLGDYRVKSKNRLLLEVSISRIFAFFLPTEAHMLSHMNSQ